MAPEEEVRDDDRPRTQGKIVRVTENNWIAVAICAGGLFINNYALTNVFPYMGPMVVHLGKVEHIDEAGYYVGFLGTAFMGARASSSFFWGVLSDRIGRKPIILLGCTSFIVFQIMLGFATTFEVVVAARLLMGFFNPLVGLCKTVVCEVVNDDNQTKALSYLTGWAAMGMVLGPTIGGWLSEPAEKFPNVAFASSELLKTFPYVLPNLFGSFMSFIMFLAVFFFLPESLVVDNNEYYTQISTADEDNDDTRVEMELTNRIDTEVAASTDIDDGLIKRHLIQERKRPILEVGSIISAICPLGRMYKFLCDPSKRMATLMYSCYAFTSIFYSEMNPLWYLASREAGGLDLTSANIGTIMSISGVGLFLYNGCIFPLMSHMLTPIRLIQFGLTGVAVFYAVVPFLSDIEPPGFKFMNVDTWFYVLLQFSSMLGMILRNHASVGINICVNNACVSSERGAMNGLVMALGSVFKAVGPLAGAEIFAWSINSGNSFPFDYHFGFFVISILSFALVFYSKYLPLSLNEKRN
mmetsp:Transcript_19598/g.25035  ORF Transcript_19598/g.25035 Transcript_19598/m.25035 type:complete len:525 (-) Transcript_19598:979-2553(-)